MVVMPVVPVVVMPMVIGLGAGAGGHGAQGGRGDQGGDDGLHLYDLSKKRTGRTPRPGMNARHPRDGEVDEGLAPATNAVMMAHGADLVAMTMAHGARVGGCGDGGEGADGRHGGDQDILHLRLPR